MGFIRDTTAKLNHNRIKQLEKENKLTDKKMEDIKKIMKT